MLNKAILMGRLTKDPEIKYTPNNVAVCTFTLAVDRNFVRQGEQRQADFISVVAWRNTAEFVSKYFSKGQMMALSGSIQTRTWDDQEGKRHYTTEVVADEVYFGESKRNASSEQRPDTAPASYTPPAAGNDDFSVLPDDDELPF